MRSAREGHIRSRDGLRLFYRDYSGAAARMPRSVWPGWLAFAALRRIPTLLLRGALSDVLPPPTVARMRREKPDLVYAEVPERGRAPLLDESASVAAIDAFLARLP